MASDSFFESLRFFKASEFRHPDLVNEEALLFLDTARALYGLPLYVTSDARTAEENAAASGSSPTSLHLLGRAFDLRYPPTTEAAWRLVSAVQRLAYERAKSVELELVHSARDQHVHLGLFADGRPSRLEVNAD